MPQIIVTAGDSAELEGRVMLRERINTSDFESERFAVNLLERLGWAVSDAADAEQDGPEVHEETRTDELVEAAKSPELVKA
ncbi:MAG TPA: hypothetical protein VMD09_17200 [Solirubrobacteraceae bacterium]|nr:hypothetical protein [Solirubrobacteraceae bacterium]